MTTTGALGMIFVGCEGGVTHSPAENIATADAEAGARVSFQVSSDFPEIL